jgi:hypothetical protein
MAAQQQQQAVSPLIKGRPVSSIEEARAIPIDFDGSVFYFPDIANRRIYTKQINLDGTSTLNMYELKEIPVASPNLNNNYVTREEFEQALAQLKDNLIRAATPPMESNQVAVETPVTISPPSPLNF